MTATDDPVAADPVDLVLPADYADDRLTFMDVMPAGLAVHSGGRE